jgi:hypothetical protein
VAADMARLTLGRRAVSEATGTALLLAAVVGSGIMGHRLAGGNVAIALLANTLAQDVPGFLLAQAAGASPATILFSWLVPTLPTSANEVIVPPGRQHSSSRSV